MSKRKNNIYAVTVARFATMYIEADNVEEALQIAKDNKDELCLDDFADSENEVHSYEAYSTEAESYMDPDGIWTKDGKMTAKQYINELNQED